MSLSNSVTFFFLGACVIFRDTNTPGILEWYFSEVEQDSSVEEFQVVRTSERVTTRI